MRLTSQSHSVITTVLCSVAVILCHAFGLATAAAQNTNKGVSLTPSLQELSLEGSEPSSFPIKIQNHSDKPVVVQLTASDFEASEDTGSVVLKNNDAAEYGLAKWIVLDKSSVTLAPQATDSILVTIKNSDELSPGGHYGAVIASVTTPEEAGKSVAVNEQLATLIQAKKLGGEKYGLTLNNITLPYFELALPKSLDLSFHNTGNVHVYPRGLVTITNTHNKTVAKGIINEASASLLPEKTRKYTVALVNEPAKLRPGRYTMTIQFRHDATDTFSNTAIKFFVITPELITALVVAVVGLVLLVVLVRRRHRKH